METVEEIVIVGAGIAGLTTSLGLHRLGIGSLVLESCESLRLTGFALTIWTNGWKVLDAIGIAHSLRQQHCQLPLRGGRHEVRCVRRKALLEALAQELPKDTIRFSSEVIAIEDSGFFKIVHLSDATIIKTKVLIGCDGVNSTVAKWLGLKKPVFAERFAIRGYAELESDDRPESRDFWFFKNGVRLACEPCDDKLVYWFVNWIPSVEEKLEMEKNDPHVLKQVALSKLGDQMPDHVKFAIENTKLDNVAYSGFRYRLFWDVLTGTISKGNVCVVGDAFHPTTPYIGQGGCVALEDGLVLARCLAQAFAQKTGNERTSKEGGENEELKRIKYAVEMYTKERWWRVIKAIAITNIAGSILLSDGVIMKFLREKVLGKIMLKLIWHLADFDCLKLN